MENFSYQGRITSGVLLGITGPEGMAGILLKLARLLLQCPTHFGWLLNDECFAWC